MIQKVSVYEKETPQSITLKTNTCHPEEEPQATNACSHKTLGRHQSKAITSLLRIRMIAKLERTLSNA